MNFDKTHSYNYNDLSRCKDNHLLFPFQIFYVKTHITKLFFTFAYLNRFSMAQKYYVFSGLGADEAVRKVFLEGAFAAHTQLSLAFLHNTL